MTGDAPIAIEKVEVNVSVSLILCLPHKSNMCPGSEGDKCWFRHEVDEFGGHMLRGVDGWLGAVLLLPVGEVEGGRMMLHM